MKPYIKQATIEDLPLIYANELAYIKEIEPTNEPRWMKSIPNHLNQWIKMIQTTYIISNESGNIGHYSWVCNDDCALLCSIYIKPQYRRLGFASMLLFNFENDALSSGLTELSLGVVVGNPAEKLYQSSMYQFISCRDGYNYYLKILNTHPENSCR